MAVSESCDCEETQNNESLENNTTGASSSTLENLPPELRAQVLTHIPDLPTLHAIVRASPTYHTQYREHRNSILCTCLARDLDGYQVDAYATFESNVKNIGTPRGDEKITEFLDNYRQWLSDPTVIPEFRSMDPHRVRYMAGYHLVIVRPLAQKFADWALENVKNAGFVVASQSSSANVVVPALLSRSEEIRTFQALYRYATYHHLFGENKGRRHGSFRHHEINDIFCGKFDPWENEALGCIEEFVRTSYERVFEEIKPDFREKDKGNRPWINGKEEIELDARHDDYMNGTLTRGLKMAAQILSINDHEQLVAEMEKYLTPYQHLDATLRRTMSEVAQDDRRLLLDSFPAARDRAEDRREPMLFRGDHVPLNGPPLGWVLLWNGTYTNIYGEYIPTSLKQWGCVIWDERRIVSLGIKDVVAKQWELYPDLVNHIETDYEWSPIGLEPLYGQNL